MEVRKITENDNYDGISTIYAKSWKASYDGIILQEYLDGIVDTQWSKHIKEQDYINLVLTDENKYIGTASLCSARDKKMQGWGEIVSIYLLPDYIGRGCGKLLLDYAMVTLKNMGFSNIYLWVLEENNRAKCFYEKNGFLLTSKKTKIIIGGKELTEVMYITERV